MAESSEPSGTRRDFIYIATAAVGVVAVGTFVWPLINQMNADAGTRALSSVKVRYDGVQEGQQIVVTWLGKPVFIRRRTAEEVETSRRVLAGAVPDQLARNANLPDDAPATDENRSFGENGEWMITIGVCTHLGCVPSVTEGDYNGWYCKCHGSHYDLAARIRRGPAPENLPIPPLEFLPDGVSVQIG